MRRVFWTSIRNVKFYINAFEYNVYHRCLCYFLNCCLFERLFRVKKNGVFLLGLSFFVLEIFTFQYYANKDSDDVIGGSTTLNRE